MIFCRTYQLEEVLLTLGQRFVILKVSRAVVITLFRIVCQIIKLAGFTAAITLVSVLCIIISLKYTLTDFLDLPLERVLCTTGKLFLHN